MSPNLNTIPCEKLHARMVRFSDIKNLISNSSLPSLALVIIENEIEKRQFENAITNLLESGVKQFCIVGNDAGDLHDIIDDIIIDGNYEKTGIFRRNPIPTSIHTDESLEETVLFIDTQIQLRKLNETIIFVYDLESERVSDWMKYFNI